MSGLPRVMSGLPRVMSGAQYCCIDTLQYALEFISKDR